MQKRAIIYIVCVLGFLDFSIAGGRSRRDNGVSGELPQSSDDDKKRRVLHHRMENTHGSLNAALVEQCWNRGTPQPYPSYYAVLKNVTECLKSEANYSLDLDQLALELSYPGPQNEWKEMVEKICPRRDEIEACSRPAAESFNVCYDASELKALKTTRDMSRAIVDYVCKDNGATLLAFIEDRECLSKSMNPGVNCASKLGTLPQNRRNGNPTAENDFLAFMKFDKDQCYEMQYIRLCARTELEKCDNQGMVNFMDDVLSAAMGPPCSGASGDWRISSTLFTVLTVILVYPTFT